MGPNAAYDAYKNYTRKGEDFFSVVWQINLKRPTEVGLRVESPCEIGKSRYEGGNNYLNELKRQVIAALLDPTINWSDMVKAKGYQYEWGLQRSEDNQRRNRSTLLFKVVLPESQSERPFEGGMKAVHNEIGSSVEQVLQRLRVAEKLKKYFEGQE
jgi:hypothetical protein